LESDDAAAGGSYQPYLPDPPCLPQSERLMITALEAVARLRDGNRRFVESLALGTSAGSGVRRAIQMATQEPFAIILGCSDSRVPAELVFDQGFGDLFVIRVAGNIVAPSQIGSVEFAAAQFATRLVVVLGHSLCGAITATLAELRGQSPANSRNLRSIVDRVMPAVRGVLADGPHDDPIALVHEAVLANVRASVDQLQHGSELLEDLILRDGLLVVGAYYSLETGVVTFL
jgi:carbonic anhydrase